MNALDRIARVGRAAWLADAVAEPRVGVAAALFVGLTSA